MGKSLSLRLPPVWDELDGAVQHTQAFLREQGLGDDAIQALSMVSRELLENAVKYGDYVGDSTISLELACDAAGVTVEVHNPISRENEPNLQRLDQMIQWIRGFQDPFQAYLERLKEVSAQRLDMRESGLGLVRIAYEGQSIIDFVVDSHHRLSVSAVHRLR